jgi:hypothetical protein
MLSETMLDQKSRKVGLTHVEYSTFLTEWYQDFLRPNNPGKKELRSLLEYLKTGNVNLMKRKFRIAKHPIPTNEGSTTRRLSKFYILLYKFLSSLDINPSEVEIVLAKVLQKNEEKVRIIYQVYPENKKNSYATYDQDGITFFSTRLPKVNELKFAKSLKGYKKKVQIIEQLYPKNFKHTATIDDNNGITFCI